MGKYLLSLPDELHTWLRLKAANDGRTIQWLLVQAAEEYRIGHIIVRDAIEKLGEPVSVLSPPPPPAGWDEVKPPVVFAGGGSLLPIPMSLDDEITHIDVGDVPLEEDDDMNEPPPAFFLRSRWKIAFPDRPYPATDDIARWKLDPKEDS